MYLHEGACKTNASPHWMLWALGLGKTGWLPDYLIKYGHVSIKSCHRYTSSFLHLPHLTKKSCDGKLRHFPQCGKLLSTFKRIISNLSALKNAVVLTLHSFCHLLRLVPEVLGLLSLFHKKAWITREQSFCFFQGSVVEFLTSISQSFEYFIFLLT